MAKLEIKFRANPILETFRDVFGLWEICCQNLKPRFNFQPEINKLPTNRSGVESKNQTVVSWNRVSKAITVNFVAETFSC